MLFKKPAAFLLLRNRRLFSWLPSKMAQATKETVITSAVVI